MKKSILLIAGLVIVAIFAGCVGPKETAAPPTTTPIPTTAPPAAPMYKGTIYVAGEGGHISVANVEIDPTNTNSPIKVNNLKRIVIGPTEPIHDVRVDANDKTKLYWSTILPDSNSQNHYGIVDLTTNKKVEDIAIDLDPTYVGAPSYCASGQSANEYLPVFMGYEGYVDVFDKATLDLKHRVFFRGDDFKTDYVFYHGTNTPDMSKFLLISNGATNSEGQLFEGKTGLTGEVNFYLFDLESLVNGEVKLLKKNTITGYPAGTIAFRQGFTPDGKYLLQSGRDRFFLVDANTLEVVKEEAMPKVNDVQVENHDAMSTPDSKYAILTLRSPVTEEGATVMDGHLQLYDITNKKVVGKSVSVCKGCHSTMGINVGKDAMLCGEDAVWQ